MTIEIYCLDSASVFCADVGGKWSMWSGVMLIEKINNCFTLGIVDE